MRRIERMLEPLEKLLLPIEPTLQRTLDLICLGRATRDLMWRTPKMPWQFL